MFDHVLARRRAFALPHFELVPLEFEALASADELLLDRPLDAAGLTAAPPAPCAVPSAGELSESIERHLRGDRGNPGRADGADELRNALAELRRSLA